MAKFVQLAEQYKIVDATSGPVTTNGGVTTDAVSVKNAQYAELHLQFTQAVGHATVITLQECTAVDGTGAATVANAMRIRSNLDTAASDTLVVRTAATSYTLAGTVKKMQVIFEIDPARLSSGSDVLRATVSDSSQATNFVSGQWYLLQSQQQATPPVAITD